MQQTIVRNNSFFKNPCNWYLLAWCAYLLQGTLYAEGSIVSRSILVVILLVSITHVIPVLTARTVTPFFKVLLGLLVLYTIHGVLLYLEGGSTVGKSNQTIAIGFLQSFYISILPIFSFYYYAKKGYLTIESIRSWVFIFVIVAVALFYRMQRETMEKMETGFDDITNNAGYVITALIPCVFVFKKQWIQYSLIVFCVFFTFLSMKRGAILTGSVALILYLFMRTRSMKPWTRLAFLFSTAVVGYFLYDYLQETIFQNSYFQFRIERTLEGGSSGRDELFEKCINYFVNREDLTQQFLGLGANGTLSVAGNGAHNDWLEMLLNLGIVGGLLFLLFWIVFYKMIRSKSLSRLSRNTLTLVFVICFLRTFFSQSINDISIFLSSIMGLAICDGFAGMNSDNDYSKHLSIER